MELLRVSSCILAKAQQRVCGKAGDSRATSEGRKIGKVDRWYERRDVCMSTDGGDHFLHMK